MQKIIYEYFFFISSTDKRTYWKLIVIEYYTCILQKIY